MNENIDIVVADKVAPSISKNILAIGKAADTSQTSINKLQKALDAIGSSGLSKLESQVNSLTSKLESMSTSVGKLTTAQNRQSESQARLAVSQQRLTTEIQKTLAAELAAEAAMTRAIKAERDLDTATVKLATSQQQLAASTARTEKAQLALADAQKKSEDAAKKNATVNDNLMNILKVATVALVAREFIQLADAATNLNSKLKLVTSSSQELGYVTSELYKISQESRVNFIELGGTYAQIARSAKDAGVSQSALLGITKTISQAMTIGGGSAQSMNAALIQLSQGFASGVLRGEELNSVMEQTPRLAQAIAQGLGVSIGKLRQLGSEGKLTSEAVLGALQKAAPAVAAEFEKITPTVSQAFTVLNNALVKTVGDFDKASGASATLAKAIITVGTAVSSLGDLIAKYETPFSILAGGLGGAAAAAGLYAVAKGVTAIYVQMGILNAFMLANPLLLTLLGITVAVGAAVAGFNAYKGTVSGIEQTNAALVRQRDIIEKSLASGKLNDLQQTNYVKTLGEVNAKIAENNVKLDQASGATAKASLRTQEINARNLEAAESERKRSEGLDYYNKQIQKNKGVEESLLKQMETNKQMLESGKLTQEQYNVLLAQTEKEYQKQIGATAAHNKSLKENESVYKSISGATTDKIAQMKAELLGTRALSDVEKFLVKIETDLGEAKGKLTAAQTVEIEKRLENVKSLDAEIKKKKQALDIEEEILKNTEELAKALADMDNAAQNTQAGVDAYVKGLKEANDETKLEQSLFGKSQRDRNIALGQYKLQLDLQKQIEIVNDKNSGMNQQQRADAIAQLNAQNELAKQGLIVKENLSEQINILNSVEQTAHDAFINIFEGGQDAFKKIGNTIKSAILEMLYQLTVKKWVVNISANLLGTGGSAGGIVNAITGSGGSGGSALDIMSNLSSLSNAFTGGGINGVLANLASGTVLQAGANAGLASSIGISAGEAAAGAKAAALAQGGLPAAGAGGAGAAGEALAAAGPVAALLAFVAIGGEIMKATRGETRYGGRYAIAGQNGVTDPGTGYTTNLAGHYQGSDSGGNVTGRFLRDIRGINAGATNFASTEAYADPANTVAGQAYYVAGPSGKLGTAQDDAMAKLLESTQTGINAILTGVGSTAKLATLWGGFETSDKGRGGVGSGGSLSSGGMFGESGKGSVYTGDLFEKYSSNSPDYATALANYITDLKQTTLQAVNAAIDIPKSISDLIPKAASEIEALTDAQLDSIITTIGTKITEVANFRTAVESLPFENLKNLSFDTTSALIAMNGSLDNLKTNWTGFFENFYTETEKQAMGMQNLQTIFDSLNVAMPTTRAGFKDLVNGLDLTIESNQVLYSTLLSIQGAFASVIPAATETNEVLRDTASILQERASLERQLLQAQGNTAALRELELAGLDESNRAIQLQIWAIEDAKKAAQTSSQAYTSLANSVTSSTTSIKNSIQSVIDVLKTNIDQLYGKVSTTSGITGAAGTKFVQDALTSVMKGGALPDSQKLQEAITAIRDSIESDKKTSVSQKESDLLILASRLNLLNSYANARLSGNALPSYDVGSNYIKRDQIAKVHAGEEITPAKYVNSNKEEMFTLLTQLIKEAQESNTYLKGIDSDTDTLQRNSTAIVTGQRSVNVKVVA